MISSGKNASRPNVRVHESPLANDSKYGTACISPTLNSAQPFPEFVPFDMFLGMRFNRSSQRNDQSDIVRQNVASLPGDHPLTILRLEDAFDPEWWGSTDPGAPQHPSILRLAPSLVALASSPRARLQQFLNSLPTPSAVSSMILQLSRVLLLHTARSQQCSHLLLSDSLTSLSISLISSLASGGGFHVSAEQEERWESIQVVKPLRDTSAKECAAAFRWRGLSTIGSGAIDHPDRGIRKVTRGLFSSG